MPLTAAIEVPPGQADPATFRIKLRITNEAATTTAVLNPNMGVPAPSMNWPYSHETYQTAMLMSFSYLSISVNDATGHELPLQAIATWATPVILPKVELALGQSIELTIPIGEFYLLRPGTPYQVALEYGDRELKVTAHAKVSFG